MQLNPIKIMAFFILLVAGGQLFYFLRTGEVRMQGGTTISRHERPVLFWLMVGIGCWGVFISVALLIYLPNWIGR